MKINTEKYQTNIVNELSKYNNSFNDNNFTYKKNKILLLNTSMKEDDYFSRLYTQNQNNYPHFFINEKGEMFQLYDETKYYNSTITNNLLINRHSIIIAIENLGWLKQVGSIEDNDLGYVNWYNILVPENDVFKKDYRNQKYWHTYSKNIYTSLKLLLPHLIKKHKIKKDYIKHCFEYENIDEYEGILTRSNICSSYTDVSPAFNFNEICKLLKNEK